MIHPLALLLIALVGLPVMVRVLWVYIEGGWG